MGDYTIDVCCTCGRLAFWPFCEHRPTRYSPERTPGWCMPVQVKLTDAARTALRREMERREVEASSG